MKNDLDVKLQRLLQAQANRRFAWGRFDCCQFVLEAARALADRGLTVPAYRTERGALRVLRQLGGYDGAVAALGGKALVSPALAQRGDIVLVSAPGLLGSALAVCTGAAAHAPGDRGLEAVPMNQWIKAWRLECPK